MKIDWNIVVFMGMVFIGAGIMLVFSGCASKLTIAKKCLKVEQDDYYICEKL